MSQPHAVQAASAPAKPSRPFASNTPTTARVAPRSGLGGLLTLLLLAASSQSARAQTPPTWPTQPVRLLVGFTAGGPTDIVARSLAEAVGKSIGQPVIVDNRPGANTIIAAQAVAQAKDQHTLLMAATNHTMIAALYSRQIQFDPVKSFKGVCRIAATPTVLVVGPQTGLRNLADFVQQAKGAGRGVTYASPGLGSSVHFAAEDFAQRAGVQLTHVPYKGAAPALADVMAGQVTASFASLGSVLASVKAGKLVALAIASPKRSEALPAVPTFEESGIKSYRADAWYGVLAPAQLPEAALKKMQTEVSRYVGSSAGTDKLQQLGMEPALLCGDEFDRQLASETAHWTRLAEQLKIKDD